jgi:DNA-binding NtrC family response regulator
MAKKRILIVDDAELLREGLREWLIADGFDVEAASTGKEAIDKVNSSKFDIAILDLKLPDIDGLQLYEYIKKIDPKIAGIMITGYPSQETEEKAKKLGLADFLPKPFDLDGLEKVIDHVIAEADRNHSWEALQLVSFRLCDRSYQCKTCPFFQSIQDRLLQQISVAMSESDAAKYMQLPGPERLCRFAAAKFAPRK